MTVIEHRWSGVIFRIVMHCAIHRACAVEMSASLLVVEKTS